MSISNTNVFHGGLAENAGIEKLAAVPQSPNVLAQAGAKSSINAAGSMINGVVSSLLPLAPVAGIGFLTWWGFDMILGGALSGKKRV